MTCREKLKQEHPEKVNKCYAGGCSGCPYFYGYRPPGECMMITSMRIGCVLKSCRECWDQEVMEGNETTERRQANEGKSGI